MWERTRGTGGGSPGRIQGRDTGGGKRKGTVEVGILKGREGEEIKFGEIRQHRLKLPNRKRAEVAGKSRKKKSGNWKYNGKRGGNMDPRPCCFCVSSFSPFSHFSLFAPLFHTSHSGYDFFFFFKIHELAKATNPGDNEKLKKRDPFETRLRKVLAKKNCYL